MAVSIDFHVTVGWGTNYDRHLVAWAQPLWTVCNRFRCCTLFLCYISVNTTTCSTYMDGNALGVFLLRNVRPNAPVVLFACNHVCSPLWSSVGTRTAAETTFNILKECVH
jgi:hypothetical protein